MKSETGGSIQKKSGKQSIPSKITRDHILQALKEIDEKKWDKENNSIKYDLLFEGKRYPPKIVVKYANKYLTGEFLDVSRFSGGEDTTNKFFRVKNFEIDFKPKSSDNFILNKVYSREDLKTQFNIIDATINNGIFKPNGFSSVWLFITEEKTPDRTQYKDYFDGEFLHFEGQTQKRTDHLIIDHKNDGNEILVFYRKMKNEFSNFGFRYLGKFHYISSSESEPGPTKFILSSHEISPDNNQLAIKSRTSMKFNRTDPPELSPFPEIFDSNREDSVRKKIDYAARQANNTEIGDAGELAVIEIEKNFLISHNASHLIDKIEHVAKKQDNLGYDIQSISPNGDPKFIEVKTTVKGKTEPFILTAKEFTVSRDSADYYYLYRIYDFDKTKNNIDYYVLEGDLTNQIDKVPIQYLCRPYRKKIDSTKYIDS